MYWGKNLPDEVYEKQDDIRPNFRLQKFPTEEEFWSSNVHMEFRYNFSKYAERRKFLAWILKEVDSEEVTDFNAILDEKFGKLETYDSLNKIGREEVRSATVYEYTEKDITGRDQELSKYPMIYPPKAIYVDDPEAEIFNNSFYQKQKALKGLQRVKEEDDVNQQ